MILIDTSNMTKEEIDLLESLVGKVTSKSEHKVKPKKTEIEEYNMKVRTKCLTCDSIYNQVIGMRHNLDRTGLVSIHLSGDTALDPSVKVVEEQREVLTCCNCYKILFTKSKEELVFKILDYRKKMVKS